MNSVLLIVLYLLTIGMSACSCGWLLLKAERNGAAAALAACQLLVIIWCIPQLFLGLSMTKETKYLAYGISYLGISFIGPAWLVFSFLYCRQRLSRPALVLLFGLSFLHYMIFLTNERHHLFYLQFEAEKVVYGKMFYVHMGYTYFCVVGGMGAVLREFWKKRVAAVHLAVILLSAAVPLGFNVLYLSGWAKTSFDLTPLAFALSSFLMVLAVLRYDFLDVRGLAFEQILSSMAEGVAVYNKQGAIVYCNQAAKEWLKIRRGDDFECIKQTLGSQGILTEMEREPLQEDSVFRLGETGKIRVKQYLCRDKGGGLAAGIFLLSDVSEYYERLRQSRELALSAQKLAIEQERNRIAQEVHDTTGHTLTMIQSLVRLARVEWGQCMENGNREKIQPGAGTEPENRTREAMGEKTEADNGGSRIEEYLAQGRGGVDGDGGSRIEEYLAQAQELAVNGIRELRISINQLRAGTDGELVTRGIFQLAGEVKELDVEVSVQGKDEAKYSQLSGVAYECFREAVTNCLKYAHASHMDVILKFEENGLRMYIFDNGQGCGNIVESNGIRGIKERVEKTGGQARFLSSEGEGFQIYLWLPVTGCETVQTMEAGKKGADA